MTRVTLCIWLAPQNHMDGVLQAQLHNKDMFTLLLFILTLFIFQCEGNSNNYQTLSHGGITRRYILYVPNSYDETSEVPLMLNFHGYGGSARSHLKYTDMRPLADTEAFILVYPQGALLDGTPHWNAGLPSSENKSNIDDFGFVVALIDEISSRYNIDSKRVYACGYSNGAFFSYALACYHGDKIAAIGSVFWNNVGGNI